MSLMRQIKPNEFYHLAAESFIADSFKYPNTVMSMNTHATCNILEALRISSPSTRMFFASSSEIFGKSKPGVMLSESSDFLPLNPYAISKLSADFFVQMYRKKYGLFACSGILFNHEGPLRGGQFVTRKITHNISRLKLKEGEAFLLGNLNSYRDWGAAVDYVEAMRLMLSNEAPKDYVIASGKLSSVKDFLIKACLIVGFDPIFEGKHENEVCFDKSSGKLITKVSKDYFRPFDTEPLAGDSSKITLELGWKRMVSFEKLIESMVLADSERVKNGIIEI